MIISRHAKRVEIGGKLYLIIRTRRGMWCSIDGNQYVVDETVASHKGDIIESSRMSPELQAAASELAAMFLEDGE